MKRIIYILVLLPLVSLLHSCDIIEEPYTVTGTSTGGDDATQRVVILEEFTGHQCSNCPAAAAIAAQLHTLYGKRFIIIAHHSGWFARTSPSFPIDYTTPTSDDLYAHFGVQSNPAGVINRVNSAGGYIVSAADWGSVVASMMDGAPKVSLKANASFNSTTRKVNVEVEVTAQTTMSDAVWLCAYITESGLISPQSTNELGTYPSGVIANYEHKHVFRQAFGGTWGEVVATSMTNGQKVSKTVSGTLGASYVAGNCELVVFAYNKSSGEVLQATSLKL